MILLEKTQIALEWTDIQNRVYHPRPVHKRSEGRHVSEIIRALAIRNKRLDDSERLDEMPLVVGVGMAMEEWAVGLYPAMWWQPVEVHRDGISGSPDGLSNLPIAALNELVVEEFKATYKSNRNRQDLNNEWMWLVQVMCYCVMHELRPMYARFHVFWMADDYRMPFKPTYIRYLYQFGLRELDENWRMIVKYKDLPDMAAGGAL